MGKRLFLSCAYISSWFLSYILMLFLMFRVHPPPAFGSSSNLEALALETSESDVRSTGDTDHSVHLISR